MSSIPKLIIINIEKKLYKFYILLLFPFFIYCQEDSLNKKVGFTQTSIGLSLQTINGGNSSYIENDIHKDFNFYTQIIPTIYIGGMYLWGHVEMYFNTPLINLIPHKTHNLTYTFKQTDDLGIKIYPWKLKQNSIKPYFGFAISEISYQQSLNSIELSGVDYQKIGIPILFGISFTTKKRIFEFSTKLNLNSKLDYYISKTEVTKVNIPKIMFAINYKFYYDLEKKLDIMDDKLFKKHKKINSFYISLGPSSSYFLKNSNYNNSKSFLNKHLKTNTFIEYNIGYHFQKTNSNINISYRKSNSTLSAYGSSQSYIRQSATIEAFKYLFTFKGFSPFLGGNVSFDNIRVIDKDNVTTYLDIKRKLINSGLTLGIDIKIEELKNINLRSVIRYYPFIKINSNNNNFPLQQLEINFIQIMYSFKGRN